MSAIDTRAIARDSMFLLADVSVAGGRPARVKVRNLSAGGMMAEGTLRPARGDRLTVDLRNIGPVEGAVAWTQDDRFGIAFDQEIDPALIRSTGTPQSDFEVPRYVRSVGQNVRQDHANKRKV